MRIQFTGTAFIKPQKNPFFKSTELDRSTDEIKLFGMIQTVDSLALGAKELPPDQRFALAQRILASVEPAESTYIDDAWTAEIRERIRKYDSGETKGIPGAEVFAEIDSRLAR